MKQTHLSYLSSKLIFVLNCFLSKLFLYLRKFLFFLRVNDRSSDSSRDSDVFDFAFFRKT